MSASGPTYLKTMKEEREEKRRQKELLQRLKEQEKLDSMERAKLEVEAHECEIQSLQTVHKECSSPMDWKAVAFSLPPLQPLFSSPNHLEATLKTYFFLPEEREGCESDIASAWEKDISNYNENVQQYSKEHEKWKRHKFLAERVLAGDESAYPSSIHEFCWFGEIATWGDAFHFTSKDSKCGACIFPVNGNEIIPRELKSLTTAGKLTTKQTPKRRFHEIYQAYVCGCVLRVGRELFALLPLNEVVVTATVLMFNPSTGLDTQQPVLSVRFDRKTMDSLNFEKLNPADALENFQFNGFLKGSQKNDQFSVINPIIFDNSHKEAGGNHPFDRSLDAVMEYRKTLRLGTKSKRRNSNTNPTETVTVQE